MSNIACDKSEALTYNYRFAMAIFPFEPSFKTRNLSPMILSGNQMVYLWNHLRLAFTNDGVVVGVVIRSVEGYDLAKITPTESEAEHRSRLGLRRLPSSENYIVGVGSRNGRINQPQCSI